MRSPDVRLERHLLVLGRRGRGLRILELLHSPGILAYTEMGEPCRRAPRRPLSGAHRLYHRRFDSRSPAQSSLHSGHCTCGLLPKVPQHDRYRLAHRPGHLGRHRGADTLRPRAGLHRGQPVFRAFLCKYSRMELQYGRACICHPLCGRGRMEHPYALPPEERQPHPHLVSAHRVA